jgi:predicted transglutaminase-like cysteine proteinase
MVEASASMLHHMQQVNNYVNETILEVSDMEQYGKADHWALPTSGMGDCEDFALLKRKLLLQRGFPASSLAVVVGLSAQGEQHAVLVVSTTSGEYVLDSLHSSINPLAQSGFTVHSRQSARGFVSNAGALTSTPSVDFPVAAVIGRQRVAQR